MPEYRFYKIAKNGHIVEPATDIDAQDDKAAVDAAKQHLDGVDTEIWRGPRMVAYLVPDKR